MSTMSSPLPYDEIEPTTDPAAVAADRKAERILWWLALGASATSVVLGVMFMAWPEATLYVGAFLFGLWLLVHGAVHIVNAITGHARDGGSRALAGVLGVLFVVVGIACLRDLVVSLAVIATIIGVAWLIGGIVGLASALTARFAGGARVAVGLFGAVSVLGGIVVLVWPGPSLATIILLTGIWLVVMGAAQLFLVLRTRPTNG